MAVRGQVETMATASAAPSPSSPPQTGKLLHRHHSHGLTAVYQPSADMNLNTSWIDYPGVWTSYVLILLLLFLCFSAVGFSAGHAWTAVHLVHFAITYYFFHWKKGSPFREDQGAHDKETWWEQVDSGVQFTRNRKFFTVMPVLTFLLASHTTGYSSQLLSLNLIAVMVLLIAKFPNMHKVRIFGINADYPS
eukprot:jgi/Chlat1/3117/Chrsp21S03350